MGLIPEPLANVHRKTAKSLDCEAPDDTSARNPETEDELAQKDEEKRIESSPESHTVPASQALTFRKWPHFMSLCWGTSRAHSRFPGPWLCLDSEGQRS